MSEVVLFNHALGRAEGVLASADDLGVAGHEVHVPDLFDGRTFSTIDEDVAHRDPAAARVRLDALGP